MHERETGFGIAVQEAIIAHASEAFGQDVLEDEPQEFGAKRTRGQFSREQGVSSRIVASVLG